MPPLAQAPDQPVAPQQGRIAGLQRFDERPGASPERLVPREVLAFSERPNLGLEASADADAPVAEKGFNAAAEGVKHRCLLS